MPGTKPKNSTRQYSEKCQDADFRLLSAVTAQKEDVMPYKGAGQASGRRDLWSGRFIRQAGKPGGHENVQKRHHSHVVIRAVLFTSPVFLQPIEGRRQILGIKYALPLPAWLQ